MNTRQAVGGSLLAIVLVTAGYQLNNPPFVADAQAQVTHKSLNSRYSVETIQVHGRRQTILFDRETQTWCITDSGLMRPDEIRFQWACAK